MMRTIGSKTFLRIERKIYKRILQLRKKPIFISPTESGAMINQMS